MILSDNIASDPLKVRCSDRLVSRCCSAVQCCAKTVTWKSEALARSQSVVSGLEANDSGFCRNPGSKMLETWTGHR